MGDNSKMGLKNVGWGVDWIYLAQDSDRKWNLAIAVMNPLVLYDAEIILCRG
jgi:hypothetical protein